MKLILAAVLCLLADGGSASPSRFRGHKKKPVVSNDDGVFACLSHRGLDAVAPASTANWHDYANDYNVRVAYTPTVVVVPTANDTARQISDALGCASQHGLKVQAMSGGHSYAGYSLGGRNGSTMVISLQRLDGVGVDAASGVATVGGGVRLGNLELALQPHGRALSHGTCPGVGVGGHFTHGGFGYTSRAWGLALDQIVAMDVVMANGSHVHATADDTPELYYAMRGAADSFGIAYNFYVQTQPAPPEVVWFTFAFPAAASSVDTAVSATLHLQTMAQNASATDRNLGFGIVLETGRYTVHGTYLGSVRAFNATVLPELLRGLPAYDAASAQVAAQSWAQSLETLAGGSLAVAAGAYAAHDNFYAKSVTVPEPGLTAAALADYFAYVQGAGAAAPVSWYNIINLEGGADSQINARAGDWSAYSRRDLAWTAQHYAFVGLGEVFPAAGLGFVDGFNAAMTGAMPGTDFGAYINYVDPVLGRDEANLLYFGAEVYAKLQAYKALLDPCDLFWHPQTIPLP